jgi:hypothetical protein
VNGEVNTNCWHQLGDTEHRQRESNDYTTGNVLTAVWSDGTRFPKGHEDGGGGTTPPRLEYILLAWRLEQGAEHCLSYNAWRFTSTPPSYSNDEVLWHNDNWVFWICAKSLPGRLSSIRIPGSSVGTITRVGAGRPSSRGSTLEREAIYLLFSTVSRPALGPFQPHIQMVPMYLLLGVRRPKREADHSSPSSAQVSNSNRSSTFAICLNAAFPKLFSSGDHFY